MPEYENILFRNHQLKEFNMLHSSNCIVSCCRWVADSVENRKTNKRKPRHIVFISMFSFEIEGISNCPKIEDSRIDVGAKQNTYSKNNHRKFKNINLKAYCKRQSTIYNNKINPHLIRCTDCKNIPFTQQLFQQSFLLLQYESNKVVSTVTTQHLTINLSLELICWRTSVANWPSKHRVRVPSLFSVWLKSTKYHHLLPLFFYYMLPIHHIHNFTRQTVDSFLLPLLRDISEW